MRGGIKESDLSTQKMTRGRRGGAPAETESSALDEWGGDHDLRSGGLRTLQRPHMTSQTSAVPHPGVAWGREGVEGQRRLGLIASLHPLTWSQLAVPTLQPPGCLVPRCCMALGGPVTHSNASTGSPASVHLTPATTFSWRVTHPFVHPPIHPCGSLSHALTSPVPLAL